MIIFKKVRWKNFLSTGNTWTEMQLDAHKSTLIVGHNGAGKSTMLDAISFALFGKPHRNINKPQLINSINNKDCVVEVSFSIGQSEYKIVRGIKPNTFEIWKNSTLINQSSHAKEYQKILEQNILKLNHKSFHQVVVLGSSSFIPFMQLSGGHRRDVIEDLLDINVFSHMNIILKEKINTLKDKIKDISYQIDLSKNKIETHEKYIKDVKHLTDQNINEKRNKVIDNHKEIDSLQLVNNNLSEEIEGVHEELQNELNKLHDKKQSLLQYSAQFKQQMASVVKDAKFYEENETCPTCDQGIDSDVRERKLESSKAKAKELKSAMSKLSEESVVVEQSISTTTDSLSKIRDKQNTIHSNNQQIARLQTEITSLEEDISGSSIADLKQAEKDLKSFINDKNELLENKFKYSDEFSYNQVMSEMLKDTGIKTKIIKQYLPVINKLVNQYLQILDFFVHFDLDESFTETIRSRHRDEFTYDSFSEGEKQRIDLALLFTWRQIAKMKNSVATNLLILDETFDSSLDHEGVDNLLKILYTLGDDTNIFVISHKGEILDGKFNAKIEFKKEKNFSKIAA
jgi:DNA repair exonuclease SbcCD ATPase subunit